MASSASAVLRRRWIPAIFRSAAANRMITTSSGGGGVRSPLLMIGAERDSEGGTIYRSWSCAEKRGYSFFENKHNRGGGVGSGRAVGSSQGWLAYQAKRDLYLVDPTSYQRTNLPPMEKKVHSVVLDSTTQKAFMICGSGRGLGFCWAGRSSEWTLLSEEEAYESVVYSSIHRRLLCLTSSVKLEAWDISGFPRLDSVTELRCHRLRRPDSESRNVIFTYIVCAEQSGELFVAVRHANSNSDNDNDDEPTVGFVVYRIDGEELVRMEDSLEGMSMFVGINDPIAITHVLGVQPNCIYHTYDNRIGYNSCIAVYDYQKASIFHLPLSNISLRHPVRNPVWFTPRMDWLI